MDQATVSAFFFYCQSYYTNYRTGSSFIHEGGDGNAYHGHAIDSTSLEMVIQSAVQASEAAMSEAIRPILSRSQGWWSESQVGGGGMKGHRSTRSLQFALPVGKRFLMSKWGNRSFLWAWH